MSKKGTVEKELGQPDQFQDFVWRAYQTILDNRMKFYAGGAAVLILVFVIAGIFAYKARYESQAADLYARAFNSYESLEYAMENRLALEDAIVKYELLAEEYPRSSAARLAFYNLGNLHSALGSYERSVASFERYLGKGPRQAELRPLAWYGLGYAQEELRNYEKALEAYEKAVEYAAGSHFKAINYSNIGRVYEKMNNGDKAIFYYEKVQKNETDSLLAGLAARRLATLR